MSLELDVGKHVLAMTGEIPKWVHRPWFARALLHDHEAGPFAHPVHMGPHRGQQAPKPRCCCYEAQQHTDAHHESMGVV